MTAAALPMVIVGPQGTGKPVVAQLLQLHLNGSGAIQRCPPDALDVLLGTCVIACVDGNQADIHAVDGVTVLTALAEANRRGSTTGEAYALDWVRRDEATAPDDDA